MSVEKKECEYAILYTEKNMSVARSENKFAVSKWITMDCDECGNGAPVTLLFEVWNPSLNIWESKYVCARHVLISLVAKRDAYACIALHALKQHQ